MEPQSSATPQRLRPELPTLEPYSTPTRDAPVRLAANESPVRPAPALGRELAVEVAALALLRYCVADPSLIDGLRRASLLCQVSGPAQAAGLAALRHDRRSALMASLQGIDVLPSRANFVAFRPAAGAEAVWRGPLERGVLARDVSTVLPGFLRVTAGTTYEGDRFIDALRKVLA